MGTFSSEQCTATCNHPVNLCSTGVEMFKKQLNEGQAGDNVGLLLRGIKRDDVVRGQVTARLALIRQSAWAWRCRLHVHCPLRCLARPLHSVVGLMEMFITVQASHRRAGVLYGSPNPLKHHSSTSALHAWFAGRRWCASPAA